MKGPLLCIVNELYVHITTNEFVDTLNLQKDIDTGNDVASQSAENIIKHKNLAYSMRLSEYSDETGTGQPIELRLEETFLRSKKHQHCKMTTEEALKLIDVKNLLKKKHNIEYETSDKVHDLTNFSTAFIASVDFADKMKSIPGSPKRRCSGS